MRDRTIVLFGGGELVVGRGPGLDGLVWFDVKREGEPVQSFAMDEAAGGVLIVTVQEARGEIRCSRPSDRGQMSLGDATEAGFREHRALARVYS